MSGRTSRVGAARKLSNASSIRGPPSRPSSRAGMASNSGPAYMNPSAAAIKRAATPTESISSRASRTSPTNGLKRKTRDDDGPSRGESNVQVIVRCRGRSEREIRENSPVILSVPNGPRGTELDISTGPLTLNKTYTFDRVFGPEADQGMIYDDVVHPIVGEV